MKKSVKTLRATQSVFPYCMILFLTILVISAEFSASAQAGTLVSGLVEGTNTSTIAKPSDSYGKPNTSRIWFNSRQQRWDALVPRDDGGNSASDHYIMKDIPGGQVFTSVELEDRDNARPDIFWDDTAGKLYVLGSHNLQSTFWQVDYDAGYDEYRILTGSLGEGIVVPGITHLNGNSPASLYVSPNGNVWVAVMKEGAFQVQHSSDGGQTWMTLPVTLDDMARVGVTAWTHFENNGKTFVGVFAGENGEKDTETFFYFWYIDQYADPTGATNWIEDPPPDSMGVEQADDHVSAARDTDWNMYFAVKTESGDTSDPLIKLYKRTAGGVWSQFRVTETQEVPEESRPSMVIDDENQTISIYTNGAEIVEGPERVGSRLRASLNSLEDLDTAAFVTVFSRPETIFTDIITPKHNVNSASGTVVLAHNRTDETVWYSAEQQVSVATFHPIADAYVDEDHPNENKGSDDKLKIKAEPGKERISYLRFDPQGVNGNVSKATLYLFAKKDSYSITQVHATDNNWDEYSITYINAPSLGSLIAYSGPTRNDTWTAIDVTSLVTGPGEFSIALVETGKENEFVSREKDQAPLLVIETLPFELPPPPPLEGILTFKPVADAYVDEDHPNENKGLDDKLKIKVEPGKERISYLRFNPQGVNGNVSKATLYLFAKNDSNSAIQVYSTNNIWNEYSITYDNAPSLGSLIAHSGPTRKDTWTAIDVTSLVTGPGEFSIALVETGKENEFVSREKDQAPLLVIETLPFELPPPITVLDILTFNPVADAYVDEDHPNENKGLDDKLEIKAEPGKERISYLRFNPQIMSGNVSKATLYLFAKKDSNSVTQVYVTDNDWGEYSINYNNAPRLGELIAHSGPTRKDTWTAIDVTSLVTGPGEFSIALVETGKENEFVSRQKDQAPLLVVKTANGM